MDTVIVYSRTTLSSLITFYFTFHSWIIHISSLVEFLVAMGFAWKWADIVQNPKWKGLTWGLIPLHTSGITACTYHLFYNHIPILVSIQAILTCVGNSTAAYAAWRIAVSNGWMAKEGSFWGFMNGFGDGGGDVGIEGGIEGKAVATLDNANAIAIANVNQESPSLMGFEDLGDALALDDDYTFLIKLFLGCAAAAYVIKYGELLVDFPFEANPYAGIGFIVVPTLLNAFKWYKRSRDPTFEGWF